MTDGGRLPERDRIMQAAYRLISNNATSTTSIENILRSAGVNRRTFYRHFASKDALVIAMQEWAGALVEERLRGAVDKSETPPVAVAAWIEEYLSIGWSKNRFRDALAFLSPEFIANRGIAAALETTYARHREPLAEILTAGLADGTLPNARPDLDAFAIHAIAVRHLETRIRGRRHTDFTDVRNQVVDLVLTGLGADPRHLKSEPPA